MVVTAAVLQRAFCLFVGWQVVEVALGIPDCFPGDDPIFSPTIFVWYLIVICALTEVAMLFARRLTPSILLTKWVDLGVLVIILAGIVVCQWAASQC